LAVGAIALVLLAIGLMGRPTGAGQTSDFFVRDGAGHVRARLGMVENAPALQFYDENGKVVAGLQVTKTDASLLFVDDQQKPRAKLGLTGSHPSLILFGDDGKQRVALSDYQDRRALILRDDQNRPRAGLEVDKNGPKLILMTEKKPNDKAKGAPH
jgi:hypothetical protein